MNIFDLECHGYICSFWLIMLVCQHHNQCSTSISVRDNFYGKNKCMHSDGHVLFAIAEYVCAYNYQKFRVLKPRSSLKFLSNKNILHCFVLTY